LTTFADIGQMLGSLTVYSVVLMTLLFSAALSDLRERTVPNSLILLGLILGLGLSLVHPEFTILQSLAGAAVGLFVFLPFYFLRWLGGGDVKLFAVVGAYAGYAYLFWLVPVIVAIGGVVAIATLYYNRQFQTQHQLPYAVPIFLGSFVPLIPP
jgi:prepilin peptidase CpaA